LKELTDGASMTCYGKEFQLLKTLGEEELPGVKSAVSFV